MRLQWDELINRTAAPFPLTYVPTWTGLEREPRAMEQRVSRAATAEAAGAAHRSGRCEARRVRTRMLHAPAG